MSGAGSRARARIVASAALAGRLRIHPSRADRFRRRMEVRPIPAPPDFAALRGWPAWPRLDLDDQSRVWALTALVAARDTLAREIDGERLRRYAEAVGEEAFEAALALPAGGDRQLAPVGQLAPHGRMLAESGLPPRLAEPLGFTLPQDEGAARFVAEAEALLGEGPR